MPAILVCLETEEKREAPPCPVLPVLQAGGPGSGWPPPYIVATGQAGHAIVGMDVGSRFARVATFEQGGFQTLTPVQIPCIACRQSSGNLTVGVPYTSESSAIIQNFRNLVGTDWYIEGGGTFLNAENLTELLIKRLSKLATTSLGRPVLKAVLTVPAAYNSLQRKLIREAATASGLDVLQLINEPTAAAFAHCYENPDFAGDMLVYHLGAGTFAASIMTFRNGILEVKATRCSADISGNNFIGALMTWLAERFEQNSGFRLELDMNTMGKLQDAAERAIEDLHMAGQANVRITQLTTAESGLKHLERGKGCLADSITFKEYLNLIAPQIEQSLLLVDEAIAESRCDPQAINQMLLVGDFRPLVPFFNKFYERIPGATVLHCNPAVYPVNGAALQAALLSHSIRDFVVWDVLAEPVWVVQDSGLKQVIASGTPLPVTAYYKSESIDATVNVNVSQGRAEVVPLAELTINNCPPTTAGETKLEVQFVANADGIIDFRARHIGLEVSLPISVLDGQPVPCLNAFSDTLRTKRFDDKRLERLARIMNMTPLTVLNVLRSRGYSIDEVKNGRAIEDMLRKLKTGKSKKLAEPA